MKKTEALEQASTPEPSTGYQDEFAGQGGSYIYDPITKTRQQIKDEDEGLKNG